MILNLIMVGRDTTASALSWVTFELCTHPEVQRKVQEEVDGVLAGSPPDFENVKGLKYLDRVILETLRYVRLVETNEIVYFPPCSHTCCCRLHPSVPFEMKTAKKDDILPTGHHVLKGVRKQIKKEKKFIKC